MVEACLPRQTISDVSISRFPDGQGTISSSSFLSKLGISLRIAGRTS
jgi:hypothetical protein